jgi:hypothetical protein
MNNYFIRKLRRVVNGIPLVLMEKVVFMDVSTDTPTNAVLHSSLAGLDNPGAHPQYALSSETITRIQEVANAAQASITTLRTAIITGEIDATDVNALQQLAAADQAVTTTADFTLAGIPLSNQPPAPDNILVFEPISNTLIWRNIQDILNETEAVDLSALEAAIVQNAADISANAAGIAANAGTILNIASLIATNASDIANLEAITDGYQETIRSDYIIARLLHLSFNAAGEGITQTDPEWYYTHGIQWSDTPYSTPSSPNVPENWFGIDVGADQPGYNLGYSLGGKAGSGADYGITSLSMRVTMDQVNSRGWVFANRALANTYPVAAITNHGQFITKSGMTFLTQQPKFLIGSAATATMAAMDNYVLTYDHALSAITLEAAAGGGVSLDDVETQITGTTHDIIDATLIYSAGSPLDVGSGGGSKSGTTKLFYAENPVATDSFPILKVPAASTITEVTYQVDTGTLDFNLEQRPFATPMSAGTVIWTFGAETSSTASASTGFNNSTLNAADWLYFVASAATSTPTELWLSVTYTED